MKKLFLIAVVFLIFESWMVSAKNFEITSPDQKWTPELFSIPRDLSKDRICQIETASEEINVTKNPQNYNLKKQKSKSPIQWSSNSLLVAVL